MQTRLKVSLVFAGSLIFSMGACKKSPPATPVNAGADWTVHGGTTNEQRRRGQPAAEVIASFQR